MFYIITLVVIMIVGLIILRARKQQLRRQELEKLAQRLGWTFSPGHDKSFVHRFEFLDQLRQGSNRYASCILEGVYRECPVLAFD
ncbi:MAG: hypothetical protein HYV26_10295, partial [Candidatus Hydrogenedentes bacterium]|nr:hypothetical protein [Candidatus Hydrogenedentota bacterium]